MFISSLFMFHREKGIIDKSFPSERLQMAAVNDFRFYRGHENVGKRDCMPFLYLLRYRVFEDK